MNNPVLISDPRRGSAILTTVLITVCLSLVVFSIFEYGLFERKMNMSEVLRAQARYAAESLVENACAQAVRQLKVNSWVSNDYFSTSANPSRFTAPPATAFAGTHIVTSELQLRVPAMSSVQIVTIPSQSPDSLSGQAVEIRRLTFYGKATARDNSGREATAYCSQTLQIRGQSPATNMAFYNMELELAPGPNMTATGPFFSNKNIYFAASNSLNICGTVTTPQKLIWGRIVEDGLNAWNVSTAAQRGVVKIANKYTPASDPNAEGTYAMQNFYNSGTYSDGVKSSGDSAWTDAKWAAKENALFGSFVQTSVDGITERKLPGIKDLDNAHLVIEPAVADTATAYDKDVELQKFSNKAAIVIRPPVYAKTTVTTTKTPVSQRTVKTKTSTGAVTSDVTAPISNGNPTSSSTSSNDLKQGASIWVYVPEGSQSGTYTGPYTRENSDGSLSKYYLMDITSKVANFNSILTVTRGNATSGSNAGFYDHREATWMTMYNIDVAQLKAAVADTNNTELHTYWNGVVYVESGDDTPTSDSSTLPDESTSSTSTSGSGSNKTTTTTTTTLAVTQTSTIQKEKSGVRLVNGGLGNLPQIPGKPSSEDGFTLATNDPLYVQGNFNANGTIDTGTPSNNRVADSASETMACLAADAITILSNSWSDANSSLSKSDSRKKATQTEVSAVLMTGLVATNVGSSYSGGMHNLPRFLEYWGDNVPFGYRGSLLAFYYSQRGTGNWSNDWYQPPWRIWGWDKRLEQGRKVYGLGRVITFRRTGFNDLSPVEYATATAGL